MSRAERRREDKKKKEAVYNLTASQIEQMKLEATADAVNVAFKLMVCIPVCVLHDKYSLLTRLNVDGKSREERFADMILDLYDSFERDYITLDDLEQILYEETGMKIDRGF